MIHSQDPNFRNHTSFTADLASWHRTKLIEDFVNENELDFLLLGPYGYRLAVAELFFNMLKSTNLRDCQLKTSKK